MAFLRASVVILLLPFMVVACTPGDKSFNAVAPEQANASIIYLYRPHGVANLLLVPQISIDELNSRPMPVGEYLRFELPAGRHTVYLEAIEGNTPSRQLVIETEPGKLHYLRVQASLRFETGLHYRPYQRTFDLQVMTVDEALDEIRQCRNADAASSPRAGVKSGMEHGDEQHNEAVFSIDKTADPFAR